jgi:hypothetical protein
MNKLIDKNISEAQLSNLHRIHIDNESNDDDNKTNKSFLFRLPRWLHLIKRWKQESVPEVCKHVDRSLLL